MRKTVSQIALQNTPFDMAHNFTVSVLFMMKNDNMENNYLTGFSLTIISSTVAFSLLNIIYLLATEHFNV